MQNDAAASAPQLWVEYLGLILYINNISGFESAGEYSRPILSKQSENISKTAGKFCENRLTREVLCSIFNPIFFMFCKRKPVSKTMIKESQYVSSGD